MAPRGAKTIVPFQTVFTLRSAVIPLDFGWPPKALGLCKKPNKKKTVGCLVAGVSCQWNGPECFSFPHSEARLAAPFAVVFVSARVPGFRARCSLSLQWRCRNRRNQLGRGVFFAGREGRAGFRHCTLFSRGFVRPYLHPSVRTSVHPRAGRSVGPSVCPSMRLCVCQSLRPRVRPSMHPGASLIEWPESACYGLAARTDAPDSNHRSTLRKGLGAFTCRRRTGLLTKHLLGISENLNTPEEPKKLLVYVDSSIYLFLRGTIIA